jgi:hypothetical protein
MAQITIEGSKTTPTTFLKPGKRITVERTSLINRLLAKGYVTLVPDPSAKEHVEQIVDDQREAAAKERALTGEPAESAAKSVWAEFLTGRGVDYPADATKAQMIEAWSNRGADSDPVD